MPLKEMCYVMFCMAENFDGRHSISNCGEKVRLGWAYGAKGGQLNQHYGHPGSGTVGHTLPVRIAHHCSHETREEARIIGGRGSAALSP